MLKHSNRIHPFMNILINDPWKSNHIKLSENIFQRFPVFYLCNPNIWSNACLHVANAVPCSAVRRNDYELYCLPNNQQIYMTDTSHELPVRINNCSHWNTYKESPTNAESVPMAWRLHGFVYSIMVRTCRNGAIEVDIYKMLLIEKCGRISHSNHCIVCN